MQFDVYAHLKKTKPKDAAKAYDAGVTMLRQGRFEARRLISGLRPPILDEEGIVAAIAHLVGEVRRKKGPKIEYGSRVKFQRLAPILENAVYRIAQEALTNACKHSQSKTVRITFAQRGNRLRIEVHDRGVGFRPRISRKVSSGWPASANGPGCSGARPLSRAKSARGRGSWSSCRSCPEGTRRKRSRTNKGMSPIKVVVSAPVDSTARERRLMGITGSGVQAMKSILIAVLFLSLPALAAEKHDEAEKQAVAAAESWLALVDDGKYAESWDAAADYLKNVVTKDDFVKSLNAARKPLGKLKSREVKSKEYRTSLSGAPDGQYVVIQFKTSLENKKSAIETVTPMLDKDGKWRVSGYYIR